MICGAVVPVPGKGSRIVEGMYTPAEFGKMTIWQLRNVFGFKGEPPKMNYQEMFWHRKEILGCSPFEIWRDYRDMLAVQAAEFAKAEQSKGGGA
jgi:hypothetical protein